MRRKEGGGLPCPFHGELGPRLIQCGLGRDLLPYQVASSSIQPFGHNIHEPKTGGCALLGGAATPYNTTSPRPTFTSVPNGILIHPAVLHNRHGPEIGWGGYTFFLGVDGSPSNKVTWVEAYLHTKWHLSPSSRLATTDTGRRLGAVTL